jgi:hypothetical protein
MTNKLPTPRNPRDIDWQAVERDYRTGAFTTRELGRKHGCSHVAVGKHARNGAWTQDLRGAVRAATSAKLISATEFVPSYQRGDGSYQHGARGRGSDKAVIIAHRSDIREARDVALGLLDELRRSAMSAADKDRLAQLLVGADADPGDAAEARKLVYKALATSTRIGAIKGLVEALTKLQTAERKAFGLDDEDAGRQPDSFSEALAQFVATMHSSGGSRLPIRPPG